MLKGNKCLLPLHTWSNLVLEPRRDTKIRYKGIMVIGNFAFSEKSNKKITYCSHFISIGDHRTHGDAKQNAENMINIHKQTQKTIEEATARY